MKTPVEVAALSFENNLPLTQSGPSFELDSLPADLSPMVYGCTGPTLDADEAAFFRDSSPFGFILFKKNCETPEQLRTLVDNLRETVGWHCPIIIDQEGGRVQRMRPPHWPNFPAPRAFGDLFQKSPDKGRDALIAAVTALCAVQGEYGIDVNCIPGLDVVPFDNHAQIIGDRAYASDGATVAELGLLAARTALDCGVTPVMKHMPGHGRATLDSHFELPRIDTPQEILAKTDWHPFRHLAASMDESCSLWGMSAHIIFSDIDPDLPGTLSPKITQDIIRDHMGFNGLLLSDDIFMEALRHWGDVPTRVSRALDAGLDIILHCHGTVAERTKAAHAAPVMRTDTRDCIEAWHLNRTLKCAITKPVDSLISEMEQLLA